MNANKADDQLSPCRDVHFFTFLISPLDSMHDCVLPEPGARSEVNESGLVVWWSAVDRTDSGALAGPRRISESDRSEEHTSELQSRGHLVCRLLLEKKKTN